MFKDDEMNGVEKSYYESGELKSEVMFKDGKLNGVEKSYYKTGELESEIPYQDGKMDGDMERRLNGEKAKIFHLVCLIGDLVCFYHS